MPKRIQRERTKGWRIPQGALYVGRPSKFGNPFKVGEMYDFDGRLQIVQSQGQAVRLYRRYIELNPLTEDDLAFLRGKDLVCWCELTNRRGRPVPCHADVLLALANKQSDS